MSDATQGDNLEQSEAPLLEHLVELRARLLWVVGVFIIVLSGCLFFASEIYLLSLYCVSALPFHRAGAV